MYLLMYLWFGLALNTILGGVGSLPAGPDVVPQDSVTPLHWVEFCREDMSVVQ